MAKILLIDDDERFGLLMTRRIEKGKHSVTYRSSPFGTVNEIKRGVYDLLIIDANMPGLSGNNLIGLIRETTAIGTIKILLCTSLDEFEVRALACYRQVDGYLSKSASSLEILQTIGNLLAQRERSAP